MRSTYYRAEACRAVDVNNPIPVWLASGEPVFGAVNCWRAKKPRGYPMGDNLSGLDQTDEFLNYEVCDEALERAACTGNELAWPFTVHYCTLLNYCPGP